MMSAASATVRPICPLTKQLQMPFQVEQLNIFNCFELFKYLALILGQKGTAKHAWLLNFEKNF